MVEEFWNIPHGLVNAFYFLAGATIVIFVLGFWDKLRLWSQGMDADQELEGMGPLALIWLSITKFFSSDCFVAKRLFRRSTIRGVMLVGIMWGMLALFLGTTGRTINYYIVPWLSGGIWYLFSLILDIAGVLVLVGCGFGLYRKYISKPERMVKSTQDGILLGLLFLATLTGFLVEGARIAVLNPPAADLSPVGLVFGVITRSLIGTEALRSLHIGFWAIHFLLAFSFIAYVPFSKYEHMFASQISGFLFEEKSKKKQIPRDWVYQEEIARRKQERQNPGKVKSSA
jgi:nitrate reductase gamma subunit